jgi:hypothetical protein
VSTLRNRTIKVRRYAAGSYDGLGEWVEGTESTFDVKCSVQPLRPSEMALLPEGRELKEGLRIYSDVELKGADERAKTNADKVDITGVGDAFLYEVLGNNPWQNGIISHHKTIILKIAEGQG